MAASGSGSDKSKLSDDEVLELLGAAVSSQNIELSLQYYHAQMVMDVPAFGTVYRGEAQIRKFLERFFSVFPDYTTTADKLWHDDGHTYVLGTISGTVTGEFEGHVPNGSRVTVPVFLDMTFRDERADYELFYFDIASICRGAGVPTDAFVRTVSS